jgi:hypothetical protein
MVCWVAVRGATSSLQCADVPNRKRLYCRAAPGRMTLQLDMDSARSTTLFDQQSVRLGSQNSPAALLSHANTADLASMV